MSLIIKVGVGREHTYNISTTNDIIVEINKECKGQENVLLIEINLKDITYFIRKKDNKIKYGVKDEKAKEITYNIFPITEEILFELFPILYFSHN